MKTTAYFQHMRKRSDRVLIKDAWILQVINCPDYEEIQEDNRVRRWGRIDEAEGRYLRVILLEDEETVHNAFF